MFAWHSKRFMNTLYLFLRQRQVTKVYATHDMIHKWVVYLKPITAIVSPKTQDPVDTYVTCKCDHSNSFRVLEK